ncbi:hypothetical protein [Janthinobacterium sp. PSPC3-1]|uniref:hypothetical protein n=1 Tax=Janthinobacterium sp. PSPC3-1 TaxID=2804653 RepID=UPI003CFA9BDC
MVDNTGLTDNDGETCRKKKLETDLNNSYRIAVPMYLIIGVAAAALFGTCAVSALLEGQYSTAAFGMVFVLMGLYLMASAGSFEMSGKYIEQRTIHGRYRMDWDQVRKIEYGAQGTIIFHGENARFVLAPPGYWSGKQKPESLDFLQKTIASLDVLDYSSSSADFKIHKNVRLRTA